MSKTTKITQNNNEIDDVKKDIDSLKANVVELTKHLKGVGVAQTSHLKHDVEEKLGDLRKTGAAQVKSVEKHVRDKPAQSIMAAFAVGIVASYLLRGRR